MAPQRTEFGAKVGLLGGLVVVCALRALATAFGRDRVEARTMRIRPRATIAAALLAAGGVLAVVAVAGAGAREPERAIVAAGPDTHDLIPEIDEARIPFATLDPDVTRAFGEALTARHIGEELLRLLDIEAMAFASGDPDLLAVAAHGRRLSTQRERLAEDPTRWQTFDFDSMHVALTRSSSQGGVRVSVDGSGRTTTIEGGTAAETTPFDLRFVLRQGAGNRWYLADVIPID
jgi:hypothetical protein